MTLRGDGNAAVCRNFCAYYKPGKNEDLACRGFAVLQGIIAGGRPLPTDRPERRAVPSPGDAERLRQLVCGPCGFREQDCDFILTAGKAEPCGGLALLMHFAGSGELAIGEIERACTGA